MHFLRIFYLKIKQNLLFIYLKNNCPINKKQIGLLFISEVIYLLVRIVQMKNELIIYKNKNIKIGYLLKLYFLYLGKEIKCYCK